MSSSTFFWRAAKTIKRKWQQCLPPSRLLCEGLSEVAAHYRAWGATSAPQVPFCFLNASRLKQTSPSLYTKRCRWPRSGRAWVGFNKAGKVFPPGWRKVRRHQAISFAHHVQLGLALSKEASVANWGRIDIEEVHASSMRRGKQAWVDVNSFWLVWNWSCEAPAYHSG